MQKALRLRKNGQFQYVFRKGKGMGTRLVSLTYVRANRLQVGFSVSKKVGHAVVRNHVKRRLREIIRLQAPQLKNGYYIFVARPEAAEASYMQLEKAVNSLLRRQNLYKEHSTESGDEQS
ncbi:MAG: ribonuclease P protein component [Clostridia bacterium]|nr:ribonuclease P protein component [Clostridia bacterium]